MKKFGKKIKEAIIMTEMKRIWDNFKNIGEVKKSDSTKLVVSAACRDGVRYIAIHEFYFNKRTQEWKPARDGIVLPLSVPINNGTEIIEPYAGLITEMTKAAHALADMPLMDENHAVYIEKKARTK